MLALSHQKHLMALTRCHTKGIERSHTLTISARIPSLRYSNNLGEEKKKEKEHENGLIGRFETYTRWFCCLVGHRQHLCVSSDQRHCVDGAGSDGMRRWSRRHCALQVVASCFADESSGITRMEPTTCRWRRWRPRRIRGWGIPRMIWGRRAYHAKNFGAAAASDGNAMFSYGLTIVVK